MRSKAPSREEATRARRYLRAMKATWRFARTTPQWPHDYVLREDGSVRDFDFMRRLIERYGYQDAFGRRLSSYLVIRPYKYWVLGHALNRAAPILNAEVRRRGDRWLARRGKRIGPYGRPVDIR